MIESIQSIASPIVNTFNKAEVTNKTGDQAFVDTLNAAKELLNNTKQAESVANELTYDFMTGKNENIHGLLIAQEKSSILLQYTMQVRNQVLESYREIMRIPV
ncbi:MAG: flagellar hook-basal body complex protein FliE [Cellulosilyticaceae bacterium]